MQKHYRLVASLHITNDLVAKSFNFEPHDFWRDFKNRDENLADDDRIPSPSRNDYHERAFESQMIGG